MLKVEGVRNTKGTIAIGIYKDHNSFRKDEAFQELVLDKSGMKDGVLLHYFMLSPGTYGLALLDDENDDGRMNYKAIGVPKEGYGFSNYQHSGLKRPNFKVFSFEIRQGEKIEVDCMMKYATKERKDSN